MLAGGAWSRAVPDGDELDRRSSSINRKAVPEPFAPHHLFRPSYFSRDSIGNRVDAVKGLGYTMLRYITKEGKQTPRTYLGSASGFLN
jgi:hypothetical protein